MIAVVLLIAVASVMLVRLVIDLRRDLPAAPPASRFVDPAFLPPSARLSRW